jgi:hypothetical protein
MLWSDAEDVRCVSEMCELGGHGEELAVVRRPREPRELVKTSRRLATVEAAHGMFCLGGPINE